MREYHTTGMASLYSFCAYRMLTKWLRVCPRRKRCLDNRLFSVKCVEDSSRPAFLEFLTILNRSSSSLEELAAALPNIEFKNLDLSKLPNPQQTYYIPISEEPERFNLCLFYLPRGAALPWHDHPNQHVLLRLVRGELKIHSADLLEAGKPPIVGNEYQVFIHDLVRLRESDPPSIYRVDPDKRNIHEITAVTDSLFLDLVMPPYSSQRTITYFKTNNAQHSTQSTFTAVRERDVPLDMSQADINSLV